MEKFKLQTVVEIIEFLKQTNFFMDRESNENLTMAEKKGLAKIVKSLVETYRENHGKYNQ